MDTRSYNSRAWDAQVKRGNRWTLPVAPEVIAQARGGSFSVVLTPTRPVPRAWFPKMDGLEILCLAGGGGQQGPVLAAAGARVTVLDGSQAQLRQDRLVADREGLPLRTVRGDMRDLRCFPDASFDLVFHPCSNCFVPDIQPVWREAFRVLRPGGDLLAGFVNPVLFIFDDAALEAGRLEVRHALPYSDTELPDEERKRLEDKDEPRIHSHSLEEQIGGQLAAGFRLLELFEDASDEEPLSRFMPPYLATRARKPGLAPAGARG